MRFWDSSAVVPLCLSEPRSAAVTALASGDEELVVWWGTRVECVSALARRRREGVLAAAAERRARAVLDSLAEVWSEVQPGEAVRQRAERALMVHPLRAADALQLAAALVWAEDAPRGLELVCLDANLAEAASKEGFTVVP